MPQLHVHQIPGQGYLTKFLSSHQKRTSCDPSPKLPRLPFVDTYYPFMPKIYQIIKDHWGILTLSYPSIPELQTPVIIWTKKPNNLRDILIKVDMGSLSKAISQHTIGSCRQGTFPCLHFFNVIRGDNVYHPTAGWPIPIKGYYTCDTFFVVYLIKCPMVLSMLEKAHSA